MARGITQSDVDRAADTLLAQGERPTVDRIRQFLGTGSPNTVTRLLDAWWKSLGGRLATSAEKVAMPEAPAPVAALASQLWEQALASARELAEAALEDERTSLAASRLAADALVAAAQQAAEVSEVRASEAAAALLTAHQRLEDRQRLVDQQAQQLADLAQQRDQALARLDRAAGTTQELRDRIDALLREAETARDAHAAHIRAVEDRAHVEVDRARMEAREREKALQVAEKAHSTRVRELEAELARTRGAAADTLRDLAAEHARRETLEQQLAEAHRRLDLALKPTVRPPRLSAARKPAPTPRRPRGR
ncbi:DNA-binding protein [Cognatilysobacter terrigena]|uniref:DNA-binding protein n=1 Tax=Cognatilysobacter terrigena TaxID=2488749 RepID=UPI001414EEEA|nr:DNA-binding protein [Lysobacter terrigena]